MTMPRKRAEAIVSCFESRTCCRWIDKDHEWGLEPYGGTMYLGCRYIGSEADFGVTWRVESMHIGYHGKLDVELDEGVVIGFGLEPCEEAPL